jgi:nuclear mRNA export protein SAC3
MNPETDATAIWLERKFDVPASGRWYTENIFSIPLASGGASPVSPGLIIFECTPLEGVTDEIERLYFIPS